MRTDENCTSGLDHDWTAKGWALKGGRTQVDLVERQVVDARSRLGHLDPWSSGNH